MITHTIRDGQISRSAPHSSSRDRRSTPSSVLSPEYDPAYPEREVARIRTSPTRPRAGPTRDPGPAYPRRLVAMSSWDIADFFGAPISGTGKRWKTASISRHSPDSQECRVMLAVFHLTAKPAPMPAPSDNACAAVRRARLESARLSLCRAAASRKWYRRLDGRRASRGAVKGFRQIRYFCALLCGFTLSAAAGRCSWALCTEFSRGFGYPFERIQCFEHAWLRVRALCVVWCLQCGARRPAGARRRPEAACRRKAAGFRSVSG